MQDGDPLFVHEYNADRDFVPNPDETRWWTIAQLEESGPQYYDWEVFPTADPYVVKVGLPYLPAGATSVIQFNQQGSGTKVYETKVTSSGEKFCYTPITVAQGATKTMDSPKNSSTNTVFVSGATFGRDEDTPNWATVLEDGRIVASPGYDVPVGEYNFPVSVYRDGYPRTVVMAKVTVVDAENSSNGGSVDGSSVSDRCVAAATTVGLPLLFLIPLGFATELNIPGLSPVITQVQRQIGQINTELQRSLGMFEPNTAQFVQQINAQLNQYSQAFRGLALVAAGLLAGAYVFDNCVDGGSSSSSSSSSSDDVATTEDADASSDSSGSSSLSSE
ncbi:Rib/alpha-like domain-containing protein [Corynebacterium sp.]|uniref:Rib/alpha-like domain-containing protein n=1 Tax=Corynebacterium sp. TaxID=1720 RepID=UPI002A916E8A|nr:Rib/alpha-like domain-containing protein [Corynebacterium sp.]MDY5785543.1 Rib/alpha-like domain-containing protein [Corynebacterium sp.]